LAKKLILVDVSSSSTLTLQQENLPASKDESRDADRGHPTTCDTNSMLFNGSVYVHPSITRPDIDSLLIRRYGNFVQVLHRNRNPTINTGGSSEGRMTTALDSERTVGKAS
jgi:hypothetical protein